MNTKRIIILALAVFFLLGCGAEEKKALTLSGTVDVYSVSEPRGPMFLALLSSADFDSLQSDPLESIATVINIPDDGNFSVDLASLGFIPGDVVYCTAFIDNDYANSIPFPT
jgi:hypothetical protein